MKVRIVKNHFKYPLGTVDVEEQTGNYLIRVGTAERFVEKEEKKTEKKKEKAENTTGNVPTAKKKK